MKFEDKDEGIRTMERIMLTKAEYLGLPTFAYKIGDFTVDRDGNVTCDDPQRLKDLEYRLAEEGIAGDSFPHLDGKACVTTVLGARNLIFMLHSRQYLINRAVGYEAIRIPSEIIEDIYDRRLKLNEVIERVRKYETKGIAVLDDRICITGFPNTWVYKQIADAIVKSSMNSRYIWPDEVIEENEKYYARAWLLRLGFGGEQGLMVRKVFMKNLKGSTSFRTRESYENWVRNHDDQKDKKGQ